MKTNMKAKRLRKAYHITQLQMSNYLGCTQSALSQYEGGTRRLPEDKWKMICKLFDITDEDLGHEIEIKFNELEMEYRLNRIYITARDVEHAIKLIESFTDESNNIIVNSTLDELFTKLQKYYVK